MKFPPTGLFCFEQEGKVASLLEPVVTSIGPAKLNSYSQQPGRNCLGIVMTCRVDEKTAFAYVHKPQRARKIQNPKGEIPFRCANSSKGFDGKFDGFFKLQCVALMLQTLHFTLGARALERGHAL